MKRIQMNLWVKTFNWSEKESKNLQAILWSQDSVKEKSSLCVFIKAALWQTRIVLPKIDTCHTTQAAASSPEVTTTDERDVENGWALSKCCTDGIVFTVTTSVQGDADCTTISRNAGWPCFHYCDIMKKHGSVFPLPCSKLCTTLFLLRLF